MTMRGYIQIVVGSVLLGGGLHQTITSIPVSQQVLLWGGIALVGVFVTTIGAVRAAGGTEPRPIPDREAAVDAADSLHGR